MCLKRFVSVTDRAAQQRLISNIRDKVYKKIKSKKPLVHEMKPTHIRGPDTAGMRSRNIITLTLFISLLSQ